MIELADYGMLAARFCLSAVFLYSGASKLLHWQDGIAEVSGLGLPWPELVLPLTIVVQLGAGLMVLLGIYPFVGALILLGFTGLATLMGHRFWTAQGEERRMKLTVSLEHFAIMGGFLLLMSTGPGALSLDRLFS
ncbi:MAG: DoxX family protein [Alphaproteobacteria bacterium]